MILQTKYLDWERKNIDNSIFKEVLQHFEKNEKLSQKSIISLLLCSKKKIKQINKKYRFINNYTDVISFPAHSKELLGDIVINLNEVDEVRGKTRRKKYLQKLFIHGLLHLLDFDHFTKNGKIAMNVKEKNYHCLLNL